jgi:hypothetical protein
MMSFVKLAAYLALHVILTIFALVLITVASASIYAKSNDNLSSPLNTKIGVGVARPNQNDIIRISDENKMSLASPSSINQIHGTLIVTQKVINEGGGNKKPSDFMINVHGNDPSPSSFPGNSSGTSVKLHMGMYSITETGPAGYNTSWSDDCSGGMMSSETRKCIITNMFSKTILSNATNGN